MAAPKGHKRYGGRAAGTPNKNTQDLLEICRTKGINLFAAMVDLAMSQPDPVKQFDMYERCAQYILPKRKAMDVTLKDISHSELAAEARRRLNEAKIVGGNDGDNT